MSFSPLTVTVLTDTHYYSKEIGTSGSAYETANSRSQKLLAESPEVLSAAFEKIAEDFVELLKHFNIPAKITGI